LKFGYCSLFFSTCFEALLKLQNAPHSSPYLSLRKAEMVENAEDVLGVFKVDSRGSGKDEAVEYSHLNEQQQLIMKCLFREPLSRDELCKVTAIPISLLNRELTMLLVMDLISENGGKYSVNSG
jgi:predicted Rossmann fold nucleotide-binding protein DprA/Smf involved in DNA uptake